MTSKKEYVAVCILLFIAEYLVKETSYGLKMDIERLAREIKAELKEDTQDASEG